VGEHCEAIVAPDLVLGGLLRVLELRLEIRPVAAVKVAAEGAIGDLARDPLPREPKFHLLAQVASRLLEAPYERTRIEPRRLPAAPGPVGELRAQRAGTGPLRLGIRHDERQPGRVRNLRAVLRERHDGDACATPELVLYELAHGGLDFRLLVERRAP